MNHAMLVVAGMIALHPLPAVSQQASRPAGRPDPWQIELSQPTQHEQLTFVAHGTTLSGTIYYPPGPQRVPAVVVLHGASSPSQDLPLYAHLRQMLPPLGVAVLLFNRRSGTGQYDFHTLAEDGVAARNALANNPHIDPARIGYWGISQGGWLALLASSLDPKCAFAISVSAPMTTPDVQMNFAVQNILRIHGYDQNAIDAALRARRSDDDYLRGKLDRASAEQALDAARSQPWFPLIYMSDTVGDPKTSTWLEQMRFDPIPTVNKLSAPVLMLYGQDDPWVPVRLSMQRLQPIVSRHPSIDAIIVPGADHTMMLGVDPRDQVDPNFFPREAPNAPAYFAALTAWLERHGFAR